MMAIILNGRPYLILAEDFGLSLVLLLSKFCQGRTPTLWWHHLRLLRSYVLKIENSILNPRSEQNLLRAKSDFWRALAWIDHACERVVATLLCVIATVTFSRTNNCMNGKLIR